MNRKFLVVGILLLIQGFLRSSVESPQEKPSQQPTAPAAEPKTGNEWIQRIQDSIGQAKFCSWSMSLQVQKGAGGILAPGVHRFHFDLAGPNRVHWTETHPTSGKPVTQESWYEGFILYKRSSLSSEKLEQVEFGEREGDCIARSVAVAGILGWQIVHMTPLGRLPSTEVKIVGEDKLGDRPSVILEHDFTIKGVCGSRVDFPGCRVWVDRGSGRILKRQYAFDLKLGLESVPVDAVETYSDWVANNEIPKGIFHTEGMGPPDPIADLPVDPVEFERLQTEKTLKLKVKNFPEPQGVERFETRGGGNELRFRASSRKPQGPKPKSWTEEDTLEARARDGTLYQVFMGYGNAEVLAPGYEFPTSRTDRRHLLRDGVDSPKNLYFGRSTGGKLVPTLFFRDVGPYYLNCHMALDSKGRCNLSLVDINLEQRDSFKLYSLVGDIDGGKWLDAVLLDQATVKTRYASTRCFALEDRIVITWYRELEEGNGRGLFVVERSHAGFGKKVRLVQAMITAMDTILDPETKRILISYVTADGIFLLSRASPDDPWEGPTPLDPTLPANLEEYKRGRVWLQSNAKETFLVRAEFGGLREWQVTIAVK